MAEFTYTGENSRLRKSDLKTINGTSIVGSGDIVISGGGSGDTNVIETVKVNGTALTPDANKAVDISVPYTVYVNVTKTNDTYTADKTYTEIKSMLTNNTEVIVLYDNHRFYFKLIMVVLEGIEVIIFNTYNSYNSQLDANIILPFIENLAFLNNNTINYTKTTDLATIDDISINSVKVNGTALTPDANKAVNITVPTKTSDLTNDSNFTTLSEVTLTIVNSAPVTLDTLNELAAALGDDPNFATTVATQIGQKYTKPNTGIPASDLADGVIPDEKLSSSYQTSTLENDNLLLAGGDTYETAFSKIEKAILDNEETIAASLNDLNTRKIEIDDVPTKISELINDAGYLTSFTETDPTVPAWAKQSTKPSYTAEEVGALPDDYTPPVTSVNGQTGAVNLTIPSAVTESTVSGWGFTKNTGTYNKPSTGIPKTDLASAVQTSLGLADTAVQLQDGKINLSIPNGGISWQGTAFIISVDSNGNLIATWNDATIGTVKLIDPTRTGGNYTVAYTDDIPSYETDPTVPAWAKAANKPTYTAAEVGALPSTYTPPVTSVNGQTGAVNLTIPAAPGTLNTTATTAQSTSSSEALSGNIILHKVAKTGTYNDLIGKPTIPAAQVQSDWNATSGMGVILNKPTIPTVNNATLTIQKNGTTVNTFTANASSNVTANIQVNELPTVSSSDNGKILQVVNGAWALVTPVTVYTGTSTPNNSLGNNGDIYLQTS